MNIYDGNIYDAVLPINKDLAADTIEYYFSKSQITEKLYKTNDFAPIIIPLFGTEGSG